jgi:hypothetical protein
MFRVGQGYNTINGKDGYALASHLLGSSDKINTFIGQQFLFREHAYSINYRSC